MQTQPFALTMYEAPPPQRSGTYEYCYTETPEHWHSITPRQLTRMLSSAPYPDDKRAEIDAGCTVVLGYYAFRRRLSAEQRADQARQTSLF